MELLELVSVPVITAIVYISMQLYKYVARDNEKWIRLIPVFAELLGIALAIIAYFAIESIMPAENVYSAILIGAASGLAATGTNQIFKQISKGCSGTDACNQPKDNTDDDKKNE